MHHDFLSRVVSFIILLTVVLLGCTVGADNLTPAASNLRQSALENTDTMSDLSDTISRYRYASYVQDNSVIPVIEKQMVFDAADNLSPESDGVSLQEGIGGIADRAVVSEENCSAIWEINAPEDGLYIISFEYYPMPGKGSEIVRELSVNGQLPFFEAGFISFPRVWEHETKTPLFDSRNNQIEVKRIEKPIWSLITVSDRSGYYNEPYLFHLNKGENIISITSVREPIAFKSIIIGGTATLDLYEKPKGIPEAENFISLYEAEDADFLSDESLRASWDNTTPATQPSNGPKKRLNMISGESWTLPGQYIEWIVNVPEEALYNISLKVKHTGNSDLNCYRRLTINGEVPFSEAGMLEFAKKNKWEIYTIGNDSPYLFHLKKGENRIRIEVIPGKNAETIRRLEKSILVLNYINRMISRLTGPTPDINRDYHFEEEIPEVIDLLSQQSKELYSIIDLMVDVSGKSGANTAIVKKMAFAATRMAKEPYNIAKYFFDFKNSISGIASWMFTLRSQPLSLDYIAVTSPDKLGDIPRARAGFRESVLYHLEMFLNSFKEDYNSIGDAEIESLKTWCVTGRDQAQIIKQITDYGFTIKSKKSVSVEVVNASILLPSILSGNSCDVVLQLPADIPVNYGTRGALTELSQFADFKETTKSFMPSSVEPLGFLGKYYGLPLSQSFYMMFVRNDIFNELEIEPPETWDEVKRVITTLRKEYMDFGMPFNVEMYGTLLYQLGGSFYNKNLSATVIDSKEGVRAFVEWTNYQINYNLPIEYDFVNRFRTGEMPIGIADFSTFNTLAIFAPEIRGLWSMLPVPGTLNGDTINRTVTTAATTTAVIPIASTNKKSAWEFLKWFTSEEAQLQYSKELEARLGQSARYPTANLKAFDKLSWSVKDADTIATQRASVVSIPQVPGGYFLSRHIDNAFRAATYLNFSQRTNSANAADSLLNYTEIINDELTAKRRELNFSH